MTIKTEANELKRTQTENDFSYIWLIYLRKRRRKVIIDVPFSGSSFHA
jgi:hypothetical protein